MYMYCKCIAYFVRINTGQQASEVMTVCMQLPRIVQQQRARARHHKNLMVPGLMTGISAC